MGAGESGVGSAVLAKQKGFEVLVSDSGNIRDANRSELEQEGIPYEEGGHDLERVRAAHLIVKSPGIPDHAAVVQEAVKHGISVVSEIEFAARYTRASLIGISGTNGKTTTAHLTYHLLKAAGLKVGLAGNVGSSFARQVAREDHDHYVLELSSFQLDGMFDVRLDHAVLLNITPDHLDRYASFEEYVASKFRLGRNQTKNQYFIYCADDPVIADGLRAFPQQATMLPFTYDGGPLEQGAWVQDHTIHVKINRTDKPFTMSINQLTIAGRHNTYNSMAASIIANALLIRKETIRESLSDFRNVEHRLEFVAKVKGMDFINDSKATNVNAAWYALESMHKSVIWIAGGVDKGNDYELLKPLVRDKVRIIICLGENNMKLHQAFRKDVDMMINARSAEEAVKLAYGLGQNGEAVLLSPACASFDLFENYQDRGNQFKRAVRQL